jgi:hypothetical protein
MNDASDPVSELRCFPANPMLRIDNNSGVLGATDLDLRVESGKLP